MDASGVTNEDTGKHEAPGTLETWFRRDFYCRADWGRDVEALKVGYDGLAKIRIYTEVNCYTIVARAARGQERSYLGCVASSRKPRAGEDWTRGSDLSDGPLTEETWLAIVKDIVGYEIVRIHREAARVPDTGPIAGGGLLVASGAGVIGRIGGMRPGVLGDVMPSGE